MEQAISPQEVFEIMAAKDKFTQWLGLKVDEVGAGYCRLHYLVREEMLNGFSIIHGGVVFSAADSAFAFACNSHGRVAVALDVTISFTRPSMLGETLYVEAREVHLGHKISIYDIKTTNDKGHLVALFKGTAYRTGKMLER